MSGEFIFGWHAVEAVLKREPERLQQVWIQTGRQDRRVKTITDGLDELGVRWKVVHRKELDDKVAGVHQGVVAAVSESREWGEDDLMAMLATADQPPFLLVLDGVTDPHNLGACMRTADAVGVQAVAPFRMWATAKANMCKRRRTSMWDTEEISMWCDRGETSHASSVL